MMKVKKFTFTQSDSSGNFVPGTESSVLFDVLRCGNIFDNYPPMLQVVMEDDSVRTVYYDGADVPVKSITCVECGKRDRLNYIEFHRWELYMTRLCSDCFFWIGKVSMADWALTVRVNHEHYTVHKHDPSALFQGYGGRPFRVYFNHGLVIESRNVWSQGTIPERFWDRLPDNARLVVDPVEWSELQCRQGRDDNGMPLEGR